MDLVSVLLGYLIANGLGNKGEGHGGGAAAPPPAATPPWPYPWTPPPTPGPPSGKGGGKIHAKPGGAPPRPPGAAPPNAPPTPSTAVPERVYMIASGDMAAYVAKRFAGRVKEPDGTWTWKQLRWTGSNTPIDTTGSQPSPWAKGLTIYLPDSWTGDGGPQTGAKGAVSNAPRIHGEPVEGELDGDGSALADGGCAGVEGEELGQTTDGAETV